MENQVRPRLASWADTFLSSSNLFAAQILLAEAAQFEQSSMGLFFGGCRDLLVVLEITRDSFRDDLGKIEIARIHDCYTRRGSPPDVRSSEGPVGSYAEFLDEIWSDVFSRAGRVLNMLLEDADQPPAKSCSAKELCLRSRELDQTDRLVWWHLLIEELLSTVDRYETLPTSIDPTRPVAWRHRLQSALGPTASYSSRWKAVIRGLAYEESMLRVDYPGLLGRDDKSVRHVVEGQPDSPTSPDGGPSAESGEENGHENGQNGQNGHENGQNEKKRRKKSSSRTPIPPDKLVVDVARFIRDERRKVRAGIGRKRSKKALIAEFLSADEKSRAVEALGRQLRSDRYGWLLDVED